MDANSLLVKLTGLTLPLGIVAIVLGIVSAFRGYTLVKRSAPMRRSPLAERIALFACAACGFPAVFMAAGAAKTGNYIVALIALVQFAFALFGISAYFTRWRALTEPFAAIGLGVFAIISGFSIGGFIAPFAVAMGVLANGHARLERRHEVR